MTAAKCELALSEKELRSSMPAVCLCCGARAVVTKSRSFWRYAPVRGVPSIGIFGMIRLLTQLSEAASAGEHILHAPFCEVHANYWAGNKLLLFARLGMIGLFVVGLVLAGAFALTLGTGWAIAWAFLCVLGLAAAAGFIIYLQTGRVDQLEANPDFLLLGNVSPKFVDALNRLHPNRAAAQEGPYTTEQLKALETRQRKLQMWNVSVLPAFGTVILTLVIAVLACVGPPSNLPLPAGGAQTRGTDLHCYEMLQHGTVSHEARSWLVWRPSETVERWDHASTLSAVESLYALGARRVYYHPVTLLVILPEDGPSRQRLFQWVFTEVRKGQGEITPEEGQKYLMVAPN